MPFLVILLVLLAVFVIVINFNALRIKTPQLSTEKKEPSVEVDENLAEQNLSKMIRCKTISNKDKSKVDEAEFEKFRSLLSELYPTVYEKSEKEDIAGGLLFRIKGKSSNSPSVLMAHFDVVPVDEEKWDSDPFGGEVKDGFLWGRGTLDTKCSLFGIMESAEALLDAGFVPENDIYLSFGCNEEVAGDCAPEIVKTLKERKISPAFVLDEGGTILSGDEKYFPHNIAAVGIAEKGPMDVELTVKGESGHSSQPPEHTAVGMLSRDIFRIESRQFPMKMNFAVKAMFKALAPHTPYIGKVILGNLWCFSPLIRFFCKKNKTAAALFRTSMAFTQLEGSKGANVLPSEAKAIVNIRLSEGETPASAIEHMRKAANDPNLSFRIVNYSNATPCAKAEGKYWEAVKTSIDRNFANTVVSPYLMMGGTDSRFFNEIATEIYKFAPTLTGGGLLKTMHSDNERIRTDNIEPLIGFYTDLMKKL